MARLPLTVTASLAVAITSACGADTASHEQQPDPPTRAEAVVQQQASSELSPVDLGILRALKLAIAEDADLRAREIKFVVINGDVSVTGLVQTEDERTKINDLAMRIAGVKSVANALRVAE
jgi:hypothetical protein